MQLAQNLIIGVDAGASKTRCRLTLGNKHLLSESTVSGANLSNQPVSECIQVIIHAIKDAVKKVNDRNTFTFPFKEIRLVVGMAGLNTTSDKTMLLTYLRHFDHLDRSFLGTKSLWYNDAIIGFAANSSASQGLVIIAGTGSVAAYLSPSQIYKSGNWGYILGDGFSGFALGRELLRNLMATLDGRKKPTVFYRRLAETIKVTNPYHLVSWLSKGDSVVERTASIIGVIEKNQLSQLKEFVTQASRCAVVCAQAVQAVVTTAKIPKTDSLDIVLAGGLFEVGPIAGPIKQHLKNALPHARLIAGPHPPVEGAVQLGIESLTTTPRFFRHAVEM